MIITVAHQKGGVGKSTIAANLAVELSKKGKYTIVDLDRQKIMTYFCSIRNNQSKHKLESVCFDDDKKLIAFLNECQNNILIDCGGYDARLTRIAMIGADFILTPVGSGITELIGLKEFSLIIDEMQKSYPDLKANVFLNKITPGAINIIKDVKDFFSAYNKQFNYMETIIRRRTDFELSLESGKSVIELNSKSKAAEELKNLIKEIYVK